MIYFGKITGEIDSDTFLEVTLKNGESVYAAMTIPTGTSLSLPSKDWIDANKDKFLALVSFEGDIYNKAFIVGFYPIKGAKSEEYNTFEKLIEVLYKLIDQLSKAKTNTQIGPQPFLPDTLQVFMQLKQDIDKYKKDILPLSK